MSTCPHQTYRESSSSFPTVLIEQLTPAEIIVQRLRGAPPNDEKFEIELNKAETELLKVMQVCD